MKLFKDLKIKPFDIIIILILFASSFSVYLFFPRNVVGASAEVRVDGKVIRRFDLTKNQEWIYRSKDGKWNIIEVKDGKIRDKADNSPDQIAVKKSWISKVGDTAVCLPHQLVIEVMSGEKETEVDYST